MKAVLSKKIEATKEKEINAKNESGERSKM